MPRGALRGHDSSVANIAQGAMQGQLPLSGWGLSSQGVEQFGRSEALVSDLHHHLSFLNHVHEFDPDQGVLRCLERFEPQHGPCHPLDTSMILLHHGSCISNPTSALTPLFWGSSQASTYGAVPR